jgi:hypothetical protein
MVTIWLGGTLELVIAGPCTSVKPISEPEELDKFVDDIHKIAVKTVERFCDDPMSTLPSEQKKAAKATEDTVAATRAENTPGSVDFSLNRIARDHASYLIENNLPNMNHLDDEWDPSPGKIWKRFQQDCEASIEPALDQFRRDFQRFADLKSYSETARKAGRNIVTCADMLQDEDDCQRSARLQYLEDHPTIKDDTEFKYEWEGEPGSSMKCSPVSLQPELATKASSTGISAAITTLMERLGFL